MTCAVQVFGLCGTTTKAVTVTRTADKLTMQAKSTLDGGGPCGLWTQAQITGPTGLVSTAASCLTNGDPCYNANHVEALASLTIDLHDGLYSGVGTYKLEDETTNPWTHPTLSSEPGSGSASPFIQLTLASWNPSSITSGTATSTFTVSLLTSDHCSGNASVSGILGSVPSGVVYTWNGVFSNPSASTWVGVSGGQTSNASFVWSGGGPAGTVQATGSISAPPQSCDVRGPNAGASATANLTRN